MKPCRNGRDRGVHGTRRERAARVRHDLIHAAGECWTHRHCVVTSFFADPSEALDLERESIEEGDGPFDSLEIIRSGRVRIPRSLLQAWTNAQTRKSPATSA